MPDFGTRCIHVFPKLRHPIEIGYRRYRDSLKDSPWRKKASSSTSPSDVGKSSAAELLDDLLPLAEPSEKELHIGVAVLEVGDPAQLLELAADSGAAAVLAVPAVAEPSRWCDPGRADDLAEMLRRRGQTPEDPQVLNRS